MAAVGAGVASPVGTRSMPHFGHFPGLSEVTSGCIGQTYAGTVVGAVRVSTGTKGMPQIGQSPGRSET
jgi:hypothetical protein